MKSRLMSVLLALCMLSGVSVDAGQSNKSQTIDVHAYTLSQGLTVANRMAGPYTYHQFKNGSSVITRTVGQFTHYQFKAGASDKNQVNGWYRYPGGHKGLSGTNQQLALYPYPGSNDGVSCTSQTIGQYTYYECKPSAINCNWRLPSDIE